MKATSLAESPSIGNDGQSLLTGSFIFTFSLGAVEHFNCVLC